MKAFPTTIENHTSYGSTGMDLRDYFAAKAMQGLISCPDVDMHFKDAATYSYEMADAMMKAREK